MKRVWWLCWLLASAGGSPLALELERRGTGAHGRALLAVNGQDAQQQCQTCSTCRDPGAQCQPEDKFVKASMRVARCGARTERGARSSPC